MPTTATRPTVAERHLTLTHRIWRILPHGPRRWLFDQVMLARAPKPDLSISIPSPDSEHSWPLPFVVCGPLRAPTGIGEAARLTVQALSNAGVAVATIDITQALRQEAVVTPPDAPSATVGEGTILFFSNPPQTAVALAAITPAVLANKLRVASLVFEYQSIPKSWSRHASLFHIIAAPSAFAGETLARSLHRKVLYLPYPVGISETEEIFSKPARQTFSIIFVGDLKAAASRKNPAAVVESVIKAFPGCEGITLSMLLRGGDNTNPLVKLLRHKAQEAGLALHIDTSLVDGEEHKQRLAKADVFISLHRSEGFGLPITEAMLMGIPTIATAHGAVSEYLSDATGYPIAFKLVDALALVDFPEPGSWAEPDIAAAAKALRDIRANPDAARLKAEAGRNQILAQFGVDAFRKALNQRRWFQSPPHH